MNFFVKIEGGRITRDPNNFHKAVETRKDGWYSLGLSRPQDANISDLRACFFVRHVRAWQDKINDSCLLQMDGEVVYADNHIIYQWLKKEYGWKDEETGETKSISDAGDYKRDKFKKFMNDVKEGYFTKFHEAMGDYL